MPNQAILWKPSQQWRQLLGADSSSPGIAPNVPSRENFWNFYTELQLKTCIWDRIGQRNAIHLDH